MKILATIIKYLIWLLISVFSGMGWMRIELGKPTRATNFFTIFNGLDESIIIWIGEFIGLISFIPFILIDLYYIKRNIEIKRNQNIVRIFAILIISAIVTLIHYALEFILNWI
ncbi:hypothetical protein DOS84_09850 [Flavobacterium aquariorum]|uniref:Uncharacterized protein n=1 Tax=Flavobacterium aquariorum TaxID=2217670 RepID=A0A2W7TUL0_9FLAO|nr:hypothetical protein [Flavobacterium aquariorum]PZX93698.1 hypothetical protein DOS84_09850 [Flavobacterium aquariorum]